MHGYTPIDRVASSLGEARCDHSLSQRQLARLSGVSASTVRKIERGGRVDPALLVRLGATADGADVYRAPRLEDELAVLAASGQRQLPGEAWSS